ncbi:MAG: PaaI family thioesterase [Acidimicrobiales bacterium]
MADERMSDAGQYGTPREKIISWYDPMPTAALGKNMSGRNFLEGIRDGSIPAPPIAKLLDFAIEEVGEGRVVFGCVPDESHYNPIGMVHGGLVCTLADTVMGCAVHSLLEPGVGYTSIDLNISYVRPVHADGRKLLATGVVTKFGRRVAFSSAEIVDADRKIVATASGSLLIMDGRTL